MILKGEWVDDISILMNWIQWILLTEEILKELGYLKGQVTWWDSLSFHWKLESTQSFFAALQWLVHKHCSIQSSNPWFQHTKQEIVPLKPTHRALLTLQGVICFFFADIRPIWWNRMTIWLQEIDSIDIKIVHFCGIKWLVVVAAEFASSCRQKHVSLPSAAFAWTRGDP